MNAALDSSVKSLGTGTFFGWLDTVGGCAVLSQFFMGQEALQFVPVRSQDCQKPPANNCSAPNRQQS